MHIRRKELNTTQEVISLIKLIINHKTKIIVPGVKPKGLKIRYVTVHYVEKTKMVNLLPKTGKRSMASIRPFLLYNLLKTFENINNLE